MNIFKKKIEKNFVIVRVCVGCVMPNYSKLIGTGTYIVTIKGSKINEQYYDYQINEEDLENFIEINKNILIKNQLLDVEEKEMSDEIKPLTDNYTKREYK